MHGNAQEVCLNRTNSDCVERGGTWGYEAERCRSAVRRGVSVTTRWSDYDWTGFRVACLPAE